MIILATTNDIMQSTVYKRLTAVKREACDFTFSDFDDATFRLITPVDDKDTLFVEMTVSYWDEVQNEGALDGVKAHFVELLDGEVKNKTVRLRVRLDDYKDEAKARTLSEKLADMKNLVLGEVFRRHLRAVAKGAAPAKAALVEMRPDTVVYVEPKADRVNVAFGLGFREKTDRILGNAFLTEFVETKRKLGAAPICVFSQGPPPSMPGLDAKKFGDRAFILFGLLISHVDSDAKVDTAARLLLNFRQYLDYHIKSSKSYFHERMRLQVAQMLKILNRARLEDDGGRRGPAAGGKKSVQGA